MNTRNSPRWASLIFGLSAPAIVCIVAVMAHRHGYGPWLTLAFLYSKLGGMFFAWILFGLLLNGIVAAVRVIRGERLSKVHLERVLIIAASLAFVAVFDFVMWYPFAHRRIILGVGFAVVFSCLFLISVRRSRGMDEETIMRRTDEIFEVNDDEDHKWFGI